VHSSSSSSSSIRSSTTGGIHRATTANHSCSCTPSAAARQLHRILQLDEVWSLYRQRRTGEGEENEEREEEEEEAAVEEGHIHALWIDVRTPGSSNLTKFDTEEEKEKKVEQRQQQQESIAELGAEQTVDDRIDGTARQSRPLCDGD